MTYWVIELDKMFEYLSNKEDAFPTVWNLPDTRCWLFLIAGRSRSNAGNHNSFKLIVSPLCRTPYIVCLGLFCSRERQHFRGVGQEDPEWVRMSIGGTLTGGLRGSGNSAARVPLFVAPPCTKGPQDQLPGLTNGRTP